MDLGEWLKGLGLGQYEARFREHEIDADVLSDLTEADLDTEVSSGSFFGPERMTMRNLLQGLRDYFGAHTYKLVDDPSGKDYHTNWTGRGGTTSSSTYNV